MTTIKFARLFPQIKKDIKSAFEDGYQLVYCDDTEVSFSLENGGFSYDQGCDFTVTQLRKIGAYTKSLRPLLGFQLKNQNGSFLDHEDFEILSAVTLKWELENNPRLVMSIVEGKVRILPVFKGDIEKPQIT